MFKALFAITGLFAILIVVAEIMTAAFLWSQGRLSAQTVRDLRTILAGQSLIEPVAEEIAPAAVVPSEAQIQETRVTRVLELQARETELTLLKRMTTETANRLISDRQTFDHLRQEFRAELEQLREQTVSAASEQIRTVLITSPPEAAAERLMGLTTLEAADLLRGLPEKAIARILLAHAADPKLAARGQELFQALYRGDPQRSLIDNAAGLLNGTAPAPESPTG